MKKLFSSIIFISIFSFISCERISDFFPDNGNRDFKYTVTFWTQSEKHIEVTVNGDLIGTITQAYDESPPCHSEGCVTFETNQEKIRYSAQSVDRSSSWEEKELTLVEGCGKLHLRVNSDEDNSSEVIGRDGGSLHLDKLDVTIPPGTFLGDHTITITSRDMPDDQLFSADEEYGIYQIEGIPDYFSKEIEIKIKHDGSNTDDLYISLGQLAWAKSADKEVLSSRILDTEDTGDYLIGQIIPAGNGEGPVKTGAGKKSSGKPTYWIGVKSRINTFHNNQFRVIYDPNVTLFSQARHVFEIAESAHDILQYQLGFSFSNRVKWPFEIYIPTTLDNAIDGLCVISYQSAEHDYMKINPFILETDYLLRSTILHEYFHFVQHLYNPHRSQKHFWLDEAASVWSEDLIEKESSARFAGKYIIEPFYGLNNISESGYQEHGYGMTYFIKYLMDNCSGSPLLDIYDDISNGKDFIKAIDNQFSEPTQKWFTDFTRNFLEGKLYGEIFTDFEGSGYFMECTFDSQADSVKILIPQISELGSRLIFFPLSYEYNEKDIIEITEQNECQGLKLMLFKYKERGNKSLQFIKEAENSLSITSPKALQDEGYKLVLAISNYNFNPPDYDDEIHSQFRIVRKSPVEIDFTGFNYCKVSFESISFEWSGKDYDGEDIGATTSFDPFGLEEGISGLFNANIFNAEETVNDIHRKISITIDTNTGNIEKLQYQGNINTDYDVSSEELWIDNILLVGNNKSRIVYELNGTAVSEHIAKVGWDRKYFLSDGRNSTRHLDKMIYRSKAKITVEFEK